MDYNGKYFLVYNEDESRELQLYLFSKGIFWNTWERRPVGDELRFDAAASYGYPHAMFVGYTPSERYKITYSSEQFAINSGRTYIALPSMYMSIEDKIIKEPLEFVAPTKVQFKGDIMVGDIPLTTWTDKHYGFEVDVSKIDTLKVDPYFVSYTWELGEKDNSGALFHILKTIARFGEKNEREREIKAIYAQIKRLAELEGVTL